MGWSLTAPTLPSGSSWEQTQTTEFWANHWKLDTTRSIARLEGKSIAIKIVATMSNGSYGDFYKPGKYYLSMNAGGQTVTDTTTYDMTKGTQTFYCTGVAEPSSTVSTTVGYIDSSASRIPKTFTAPALLGPTVYIRVGGTWKQASAVYVKSSGAWKEGQLKINVGGAWK